ncbi:MAG TPA: DoxX family protein [Flavobacteriales bacterium]|nr:DoxX family protein [Flavobacteriales bacterium]
MTEETKTHWLFKCYGNGGMLFLRLWLGIAMIVHGYNSVIGGEMHGFIEYLESFQIPAPELMAWLAKGSEFFGGVLLVIGLFSKVSALFILVTMSVATFIVHEGALIGTAGELTWCYLLISIAILIQGSGKISLDHFIFKKKTLVNT